MLRRLPRTHDDPNELLLDLRHAPRGDSWWSAFCGLHSDSDWWGMRGDASERPRIPQPHASVYGSSRAIVAPQGPRQIDYRRRHRGLLEVTDHYSLAIVIGRHPDKAT